MSQSSPGLRRELRTWQSLALSIAMMSPTLAIAVYGGAPALYVGRAAPLAFILSGVGVILVGAGLVYLCRYFSHAGYGLAEGMAASADEDAPAPDIREARA